MHMIQVRSMHIDVVIIKPEPNMLEILLIIPSSTSQKITHYSYLILRS